MKAQGDAPEAARELHAHRHDPEEWDEDAERIEVRPSGAAVVACHLPVEDLDALERAAAAEGESIEAYVREAIKRRTAELAMHKTDLKR